MVIHEVNSEPPPELGQAIAEFEATFLAEYAPGRFFRIDYGRDRTAFVRSLGKEGRCFVAEKDGRVIGLMDVALVSLLLPDGSERTASYIAGIKVLEEARGRVAAARIMQSGIAWDTAWTDIRFTVAMDGTPRKPPDYTGRAGIPKLDAAGQVTVVRLPAPGGADTLEGERFLVGEEEGEALYRRLTLGRYAVMGGEPGARSSVTPAWMAHPGGLACGRFEDRRKVRRLIADDGTELRPAYLSCFAFRDAQAGVDLIIGALHRAGALGYRALRLCVTPGDLSALQCAVGPGVLAGAGAMVYATEMEAGEWSFSAGEV